MGFVGHTASCAIKEYVKVSWGLTGALPGPQRHSGCAILAKRRQVAAREGRKRSKSLDLVGSEVSYFGHIVYRTALCTPRASPINSAPYEPAYPLKYECRDSTSQNAYLECRISTSRFEWVGVRLWSWYVRWSSNVW